MDLIRVVYRLRPDVTWIGGVINAYSKETLQATYQSSQPFPTDAEVSASWAEVQAEDAAELQRLEDIVTAQVNAGLRDITPVQATAYIEAQLDTTDLDATVIPLRAATDLATAKTAIEGSLTEMRNVIIKQKEVLLKMIPYLLD